MKRLAANETVVVVPVVVHPVEVEDPPLAVPVQVRHVEVAVRVARVMNCPCHRLLNTLQAEQFEESLFLNASHQVFHF